MHRAFASFLSVFLTLFLSVSLSANYFCQQSGLKISNFISHGLDYFVEAVSWCQRQFTDVQVRKFKQRIKVRVFIRAILLFFIFTAPNISSAAAPAAPLLIDSFNPQIISWQGKFGSPQPVNDVATGKLKMPCDFITSSALKRFAWDKTYSSVQDFSAYRTFALQVYVDSEEFINSVTLHFGTSGDGSDWYSLTQPITRPGWQTIYFSQDKFQKSGSPAGWNNINIIRLSFWRESAIAGNTYILASDLSAVIPIISIVKDSQNFDPNILTTLDRYNISDGVVSELDVQGGYLVGSHMVVLPFNSGMASETVSSIQNFISTSGGKITAFGTPLANPDSRIANLLGVKSPGTAAPANPVSFSITDNTVMTYGLGVLQTPYSIKQAVSDPNASSPARVLGYWKNAMGLTTTAPAWLANNNGMYMTEVLILDKDVRKKSYLLADLMGSYIPSILPSVASIEINSIERTGEYRTYSDAVTAIRAKAQATSHQSQVETKLADADAHRNSALQAQSNQQDLKAFGEAREARLSLQDAYVWSQSPGPVGEFRAVWSNSTGPYPGDWGKAADILSNNGFNAIFSMAAKGGEAYYNSQYLPHPSVDATSDRLTAAVSSAHGRGLQLHAWVATWNFTGAPTTFTSTTMPAYGLTRQASSSMAPTDWLTPCAQANRDFQKNILLEIANNYDVDGIHLDFIRYPSSSFSYDLSCMERFNTYRSSNGLSTANTSTWPADVTGNGALKSAYDAWKPTVITSFVQEVHDAIAAINLANAQGNLTKRQIKLSAAVWDNPSDGKTYYGQDWQNWAVNKYVDVLHPMSYTNKFLQFRNLLSAQLQIGTTNNIPVYPGIGAYLMDSDGVIAQIQETRRQNSGGVVLFMYDSELAESHIPAIGSSATAAASDLSITLDVQPQQANVGDAPNYFITITNNGPSTASGVTTSGSLPNCDFGSIASGTSASCIRTVTANTAGTLTQTVSVTGTEFDSNSSNNSASASITVNPVADLSITLSSSPATVSQGQMVTYTVTVTNAGPSAASGIALSGLSGCTLPATTLASGANMSCSAVVTASTAGTLTQTVSVSGIEIDPSIANNGATTTTQVIAPDLVPTAISVDKQGSKVYVSDTVQNQGDGATGAFTIAYYLSENTTFEEGIDLPLVTASTGGIPCTRAVSSLAPGASSSVTGTLCYKPNNVVTGQRYYVLVVDANTKQVIESNASNNVMATTTQVWW